MKFAEPLIIVDLQKAVDGLDRADVFLEEETVTDGGVGFDVAEFLV